MLRHFEEFRNHPVVTQPVNRNRCIPGHAIVGIVYHTAQEFARLFVIDSPESFHCVGTDSPVRFDHPLSYPSDVAVDLADQQYRFRLDVRIRVTDQSGQTWQDSRAVGDLRQNIDHSLEFGRTVRSIQRGRELGKVPGQDHVRHDSSLKRRARTRRPGTGAGTTHRERPAVVRRQPVRM